jgi:riboflavin synthase
MFTGIVKAVGTIDSIERGGSDARAVIHLDGSALTTIEVGDSISVNGVCLTVTALEASKFCVDVSRETLERTTFAELAVGDKVNLEPALTLNTPLGGHLVSGHIDDVGSIVLRESQGASELFRIQAPIHLSKYISEKGSICVDGISLTINRVENATFDLQLIPHTLQQTTMGGYGPGQRVNIEVDLVARYVERLLNVEAAEQKPSRITKAFLQRTGYL